VQCQILALELHLLQIVALLELRPDSSEDRRALEALGPHKGVSLAQSIVVVDCILLLEVGIFTLRLVHEVFVLHQGVNAAGEEDVLRRLDARVHGSHVLIELELACAAHRCL